MTQYELRVLNHVLDDENVVFLAPFNATPFSLPQYQITIESMIQSGLLIDRNTFSERGVIMTKRLKDYKEAKKHIVIDQFRFALLDDGTAIFIFEASSAKYSLERLYIDTLPHEILTLYPEYLNCPYSVTKEKTHLLRSKLDDAYAQKTAILHIVIKTDEKNEDIAFFIDHGQIYCHEFGSNILYAFSADDFANEFARRLSL